jgi:hypothetical protein
VTPSGDEAPQAIATIDAAAAIDGVELLRPGTVSEISAADCAGVAWSRSERTPIDQAPPLMMVLIRTAP